MGALTDLDVLSVDIEMIGDEEAEPGGVEIGTRPDDPVGGEARELPGDEGQDVDGVGDDQQDGVRGVAGEVGDDAAEEGEVPLEQVEPGLAGDLAGSGGDDAEVGSGGDGVVDGGVDLGAGEEGGGVLEVEHLAAELVGLGVDEDELVGEVLGEDGLGDGHADIAGADDRDFGVALGRGRRCGAVDGLEEGLRQVQTSRTQ